MKDGSDAQPCPYNETQISIIEAAYETYTLEFLENIWRYLPTPDIKKDVVAMITDLRQMPQDVYFRELEEFFDPEDTQHATIIANIKKLHGFVNGNASEVLLNDVYKIRDTRLNPACQGVATDTEKKWFGDLFWKHILKWLEEKGTELGLPLEDSVRNCGAVLVYSGVQPETEVQHEIVEKPHSVRGCVNGKFASPYVV